MVILLDKPETETFELERTLSRPFFNEDEYAGLWVEGQAIAEHAIAEKGAAPTSAIGFPNVLIEGAEDFDYFALSTGEIKYGYGLDTPIWQIAIRKGEEGYVLHGVSSPNRKESEYIHDLPSPNGDHWTLIKSGNQGIRVYKGEVAEGGVEISGFVRRVLREAGIDDVTRQLAALKEQARNEASWHVASASMASERFYDPNNDKTARRLLARYRQIGFNGLGVVSLQNMVGKRLDNPACVAGKIGHSLEKIIPIDFAELPGVVLRAVQSSDFKTKVSTTPNLPTA